MVKFTHGNMKIRKLARYLGLKYVNVACFDLPAGWTCPGANICKTLTDKNTGNMIEKREIICYAAKAECYAPSVRRLRWHNFDQLVTAKDTDSMAELILASIPNTVKIIRIHSSGDFFNTNYFNAWVKVATLRPELVIFGYTKVLNYVIADKPDNFTIQYSYGGLDDYRRDKFFNTIPTCYINTPRNTYPVKIVCSQPGLEYQDYESILNHESFAINVH